ncbi:MAG: CAP domain-containing protein [Bacteroidota bacterium]
MNRIWGIYLIMIIALSACQSPLFSKKESSDGPKKPDATAMGQNSGQGTEEDGKIGRSDPLTMSVEERLMVDEINLVRTNPQAYIPKIKDYIQSIRKDPSLSESYKHEEASTARELIFELSRLSPLEALKPHEGLYQCGIAHARDVRQLASMTHIGVDGSYPWDRISDMTDLPDGNENLVGGGKTIRESVIILLVDSDVPGRGHRLNLLNPKWQYVGVHKVGIVGSAENTWIQLFGVEPLEEEATPAVQSSQPVARPQDTAAPPSPNPSPAAVPKESQKPPSPSSPSSQTNQPATSAADYAFMTSEERAMIEEINLLRSNPTAYVRYVNEYLEEYKKAGWDQATTDEEVQTGRELIAELEKLSPLSVLKPNKKLHQVARIHGKDMQKNGLIAHVGSDGQHPYQRIRKGTGLPDGNENLVGGASSVRESVIMLLVDSGIPNRGHRKALLEPKWRYVACVKVGEVGAMPNTWVQNFASE